MQAVLSGVHSVCSPQSIAEEHSLGPGAETVTHWLLALHSLWVPGLHPRMGSHWSFPAPRISTQATLLMHSV